jgi:acyl carrier protein
MNEILTKLQALLGELLPEDQQMIDTDTAITSLGLESIRVMEFVLEVEDHYDIAIDMDSLATIVTLADLAAVVVRETAPETE